MFGNPINTAQISPILQSSLNLIEKNDMVIIIKEKTLFQCISTLLYQTDMFAQQIQTICLQQFKQYSKMDVSTLAEYILSQQSEQFELLNLELISQIFKVKIEMYYADDGLLCYIINHGFTKTLRLFKENYNYYELQTIQQWKKQKFIRKILDQTLNSILHVNSILDLSGDRFYNGVEIGYLSAQPKKFQYPINNQSLTPQKVASQTQIPGKIIKHRQFDYSEKKIQEEKEEMDYIMSITKPNPTVIQPTQQIISSEPERKFGYLKFYQEKKQYGFLVDEKTNKDIFVHQDDLVKSKVDPDLYEKQRKNQITYFSFQVITYQGNEKRNVKATDIKFERFEAKK